MTSKQIRLSEKTVLVSFSISRWGGHAADRRVTADVHKANDASADAGAYHKRLLAPGATASLDAVVSGARIYNRDVTLPWLDAGVRILPATNYDSYMKIMKDYRQGFDQQQNDFFKQYPKLVKESKARMGKMFNEADYPTIEELKVTYRWDLTILPFPDTQDFRVTVGEDMDVIRKEMEEKLQSVWQEAMKDTGQRIAEVVGRMSERLKNYKPNKTGKRAEGTFKDSLVDNVRDLVTLLPSFNLTSDKKLGAVIAKMQKELCTHDAGLLREDDRVRKQVQKSADEVLSAISAFMA